MSHSKQKPVAGFSDEEDSHNYLDDESEMLTAEDDVEIYEYNYNDNIIEFIHSKKFYIVIAGRNSVGTKSIGKSIFLIATVIILNMALEFILKQLSLMRLKHGSGDGNIWYYLNELSLHVSVMCSLCFLLFYFIFTIGNFYIKRAYNIKLYSYDFLRILIATTFLLSVQKVIVKKISMSFNYNLYINRIKKCILFDFFINLINGMNDADVLDDTDKPVESQNTSQDVLINENKKYFSTIIFQKRFRAKDLSNISLSAKRVLLKEFQDLLKSSISYSGSLPTILGKIRSVASHNSDKLVRKLKRTNKIEKIGDLRKYFKDSYLFDYLLDGLDLNKDEAITRSNIVRIIERAYRERYLVYKSIEQVNAAIDKLAVCGKIVIYLFSIFACYISTETINDSILIGAFSTLISGHIFNRIISDHVINSAIFLFIIRPFDIGDRVRLVMNGVEENLIVSELNVFSTQFYRWDGTLVFIPNHILHNYPITNIRRSGPTMETHSIQIDTTTEPAKLYVLKQMLLEFVKSNSEVYTDYVLVNYEKIENSNKLFIKVLVQYQTNCQNYESYLKKRSFFIIELNRCLQVLGITYNLPMKNINIHKAIQDIEKTVKIN